MTAFLFVPSTDAAGRRLDFAGYASLFSDTEEAFPQTRTDPMAWGRFAAALLFALLAMGDIVLLAKPVGTMRPATSHVVPKVATL